MSVHLGQVTIPTPAAAIALVKGVTPAKVREPCYQIIVQANAGAIRVGDSTVTSTTGIAVAASNAAPGPVTLGPFSAALSLDLSTTFVIGTAGDKVDFVYVK